MIGIGNILFILWLAAAGKSLIEEYIVKSVLSIISGTILIARIRVYLPVASCL